jgi:predicted O-methyltransferase YrrM
MVFELKLLAAYGTIVVDNALFHGDPYSNEGHTGEGGRKIGEFNKMVKQDTVVHQVLLSIHV